MDPKKDSPTSVVLYMRIDPLKVLSQSRLIALAELLLSVVQLFGPFKPGYTYGWITLNEGDTKWLALFEVPEGESVPLEPTIETNPQHLSPAKPKRNGFSEDDLS